MRRLGPVMALEVRGTGHAPSVTYVIATFGGVSALLCLFERQCSPPTTPSVRDGHPPGGDSVALNRTASPRRWLGAVPSPSTGGSEPHPPRVAALHLGPPPPPATRCPRRAPRRTSPRSTSSSATPPP